MFTSQYGGSWVPLFRLINMLFFFLGISITSIIHILPSCTPVWSSDLLCSARKERKSDENYWVVGLNTSKLFCVICKNSESYPQVTEFLLPQTHLPCIIAERNFCLLQVTPKPILTLLNLSFPLALSDLGAEALENEFMMNNMHLTQVSLLLPNLVLIL